MGIDKLREKRSILLLTAMLILAAAFVLAAGTAPYFTPTPPSAINCYQNSTCFYDFNATDDQSDPYNFSIDTPPFMSGKIDPTTGIVNFTPTNDDVGIYANSWAIVKETDTGNGSIAIITWTIININDPPNITSWYPENLTNVTEKEGYWVKFNVTVDDPDLIYDDTLNYTWMIDGQINKTRLNYTNNVANYTPDYFSNGTHYVTVNVTDNASASTSITWTVNITNENRAPVNNATIPNISMIEDTGNYSVINLSEYFYDNDTDDTLTYDFVYVTGHNVTVYINATAPNNVTVLPYQNFFGINIIRFRCFDGYNYTLSNNVTINVTGVNDPPVVQQVQNQIAYVGTLKTIPVSASDPDFDTLTYYDNTTLFNINPTTGLISFTPITGEIGNYSILINVSDGIVDTSMIFNLSIINNTVPVLGKPLPDIITSEGNLTSIYFNATDADEDDTLTFSANCTPTSAKMCNITTTNTAHDNARGQIVFMPLQADVGIWTVTVTVNDSKGSSDFDTFTITVIDVEHYPQLSPYPIPNQRVKVNKTLSLNISAYDEDGNLDVFGDNTSLFDITTAGTGESKTGSISFTANDTDVGMHWVNITIKDTTNRYNWSLTLFNITLNSPPVIDPIPNMTIYEDDPQSIQVNASDPDPQDTLTYYDNTTLFDINPTTGLISFTPNSTQTGNYTINITVSDGEVNVSTIMNLTVGAYNDYPYWVSPLERYYVNESTYMNTTYWNSTNILNYTTNRTVWNSTIYEKNYTAILLDAYDEEYGTGQFKLFPAIEDQLDFSRAFINFTNASNQTVTTGINLFSDPIVYYTGHNGLMNFTPSNSQVGVYYVNLTVDDTTGRTNTTTLRLEVFNVNDNPTIINKSPELLYYQNMTENSSMMFNITATDVDYGDALHYQWVLNGTNISGANLSYYNYTTDFLSAGWRNLTVLVMDKSNATTPLNWTVNVSNVNRIGWFGQIREYNYTHFNAGVTK
ncbi:tandem-95 repeat protein, partial [archaeon]|nr:tandem-95 repeat protein [archaeon]